MSESSYRSGPVGTPLTNLLSTVEVLEGYGLPNLPGLPYYDSTGILTIGYGFALTTRNSQGQIVANTDVLAAVLDGLLLEGQPYNSAGNNYNVFAAASEAQSPLSYDQVLAYFSWLVENYGTKSVTPDALTFERDYLTEALQQFYAGNGATLYDNGIPLLPVEGDASQPVSFAFPPDDTTNAEQVLRNLIAGASIDEGAGTLDINGYSSQLYDLLQRHGLVNSSGDIEGVAANSPQWAALVAAYYNGLPGGASHGLADGDPAQTWFSLRYKTPAHYRGYVEAQLFGLNGGATTAPISLAYQDYEMLTEHRSTIIEFEQMYGINPDSPTQAGGSGIAIAYGKIQAAEPSGTLPSALQSVGSEYDLSLSQNFNPEADQIISYLENTYGSVIPQIVNATETGLAQSGDFYINSTDIFAAPSEQDVINGFATDAQMDVDAGVGDLGPSGLEEAQADHIILGTGSGDTLTGGLGDDIIVAGTGNETLIAGSGSDTLIGGLGNDTVQLGATSDVVDFQFSSASGNTETILDNAGAAGGAVYLDGLELGTTSSGLISFGTKTWEDVAGNIYTFLPDPSNAPLGFSPGTGGPDVGELQILIGGQGSNEIDIWGFNIVDAEQAADGYLGIKLRPSLSLTAGSTAGVDPPAPDFTAGSTQSYTVWMDAPSMSGQTVTMHLTDVPISDFGLVMGTSVIPINSDGTFTVTIPAGQISTSFSLTNTGDVGAAASLQLVASIPDPSDPTAVTISSAALTQNYVEPTHDPFNAPSNGTLYYLGADTTSGGLAYNFYSAQDGAVLSPTVVAGAGAGNNYIFESGEPNSSINGGTGNDTIFAQFGFKQADGGVDVINGNGGQDDILGFREASDGQATIRIYANQETDLATAIADASTEAPTGEKGDLIAFSAIATVSKKFTSRPFSRWRRTSSTGGVREPTTRQPAESASSMDQERTKGYVRYTCTRETWSTVRKVE